MTAEDLEKAGVIAYVIPERKPADLAMVPEIAACMKQHIRLFLKKQAEKTPEKIVAERYERFRQM